MKGTHVYKSPFYHEPDKNDWPGDTLSEAQFNLAVKHFSSPNHCSAPARWALIGPNEFLLEGSNYEVKRVVGGGFEPNIHWSRGYWGGSIMDTMSVPQALLFVTALAADDCKYGKP
jgi:hypothetical protein